MCKKVGVMLRGDVQKKRQMEVSIPISSRGWALTGNSGPSKEFAVIAYADVCTHTHPYPDNVADIMWTMARC
jgi:hypothetical protein